MNLYPLFLIAANLLFKKKTFVQGILQSGNRGRSEKGKKDRRVMNKLQQRAKADIPTKIHGLFLNLYSCFLAKRQPKNQEKKKEIDN